jgi:hypothetical protein
LSLKTVSIELDINLTDILHDTCKKLKCSPEYFIENAIKLSLFGSSDHGYPILDEIEDDDSFMGKLVEENCQKWRERT